MSDELLPLESDDEVMIQDMVERLANVPLFEAMATEDLQFLADHTILRHIPAHAILSDQQAQERDLYVVVRGHLEVWLDPNAIGSHGMAHRIATLFADEIAGELALVDGGVRSARLQAGENGVIVLQIGQPAILRRCEENPVFGYKLMKNLAGMLALRSRLNVLQVQSRPL